MLRTEIASHPMFFVQSLGANIADTILSGNICYFYKNIITFNIVL